MSIKGLFGKSFHNFQSASNDVESTALITTEVKERQTYIPPIDFSTASNFAIYGSAELYYENSIARIYNDYPYDGSKTEKIDFHLSSSYLDRWILAEKYPKSTGYITLGTSAKYSTSIEDYGSTTTPEYIRAWGGLHTASSGMDGQPLRNTFDKSIKYKLDLNRTQNWRIDANSGSTIEFWLKKPSYNTSNSGREVLLDLWNGEASSSANYGRLTLELTGTSTGCFIATLQSGTAGFYRQTICAPTVTTSSLTSWHHYALSFTSASSGITNRFYVDGTENTSSVLGTPIGEIPGLVTGYLGSLQTKPSGNVFHGVGSMTGYGKFSGSLDEFRFWKKRRKSQEIGYNWFRQIGGGMNSDDYTTGLGVYYKFNEGIVGGAAVDQTVLDYSGRLANGYWQGYTAGTRNTGSAMASSSYAFIETPNPIIYSNHPDVSALKVEMAASGSKHDNERGTSLYYSLPSWLTDEDTDGNQNLKKIAQILGSYFDTLHAQITAISNLKDKEYVQSKNKAIPFASRLLQEKGFIIKDILVNSDIVEMFSNVDVNAIKFQDNIDEIKNLIYTNIYNNLEAIYNSKGTEKSIRNFIRCFGIDDEIIKLNVYTDGGIHYLTDKAKATSVRKKYINFHNEDYFSSTIYQTSSVGNALTFISGSTGSVNGANNAFTLEADIVVPYKKEIDETGFLYVPFLSSSIFGFHEAIEGDPTNYTWASSNTASFSVYLCRDERNSKDAKFVLRSADSTVYLSSSYISNIYDNQHWNMAIRIKPDTYPYAGNVTQTQPAYTLSFYAVNYNFDEIANEVTLSASLSYASGSAILSNPKRVYAGAELTNFTGSALIKSDIQVGGVRSWLDYLDAPTIQAHNKDPLNFGNPRAFRGSNVFTINNKQIPSQELTIFNWEFGPVTGSDSAGNYVIDDLTSGSTNTIFGWIDGIIRREYRGRGHGFGTSNTSFIDNEFLYAQKKELPEISYTNDNIFIKSDRDINFIKDDDVSDSFYALEKSMNQVVSEEMLKTFSSIQEFSNLIGRPVDHYRSNYKRLDKIREHFFEKVEEDPNQEKFISYYKWIDASISEMILQLIPASVNFGSGVTDVIESHILERNKYQRRIGLLDTVESTEGIAKGIEELRYSWKYGHAPIGLRVGQPDPNENCLWEKERRKRTDIPDRETIREVLVNQTNASSSTFASADRTIYQGSTFVARKLSRPYRLGIDFSDSIHGGINYSKQKNRNFVRTATTVHGPVGSSGAPTNVFGIGIGLTDGIDEKQYCDDIYDPSAKKYYNATVQVGKFSGPSSNEPLSPFESYQYKLNAEMYWPFNIVSGTVKAGYNRKVATRFRSASIVSNMHSDTIDITNEIPMQGPFTEAHVGGAQSRHIKLNRYDASLITSGAGPTKNYLQDEYTRPEAWRLLLGDNPSSITPDGAMGFVGPDYGGPYPDVSRRWAIYYREETAKRPVNVRNILTTTASAVYGNYQHPYEVWNTFSNQRYLFRRATGSFLPPSIGSTMPKTTNYLTLVGQAPGRCGNFFGANSNRLPDPIYWTGAPGQTASGSFQISGAFVAAVASSGSFEMSGCYYSGTPARGRFTMTGAYNAGAKAQGAFQAYSQQTIGYNTASNPDLNYVEFGGTYYKVDTLGNSNCHIIVNSAPAASGEWITMDYGAYGASMSQVVIEFFAGTSDTTFTSNTASVNVAEVPTSQISSDITTLLNSISAMKAFQDGSTTTAFRRNVESVIYTISGADQTGGNITINAGGHSPPNYYYHTGSGPPDAWDNLESLIDNQSIYNSSYSVIRNTGSAIAITASVADLYLSAATDVYDKNKYSWIFNMDFASNGGLGYTRDQYFFFTDGPGSATAQEMFIEAGTGKLKYRVHFDVGGAWASTTFQTSSFLQSNGEIHIMDSVDGGLVHRLGGMVNIHARHEYTTGAPNSENFALYVNGYKLHNIIMTNSGDPVSNQQTYKIPSDGNLWLFSKSGSLQTNIYATCSTTAFLKWDDTKPLPENVYNNGFFKDYSNICGNNVICVTQWNLSDPVANDYTDNGVVLANHGTDLINVTSSQPARETILSFTNLSVPDEPYAYFQVTSSVTGAASNTTFSYNKTPTCYNYYKTDSEVTGGQSQSGAIYGNYVTVDGLNFIMASTASVDYGTWRYVMNTGSSLQIWKQMAARIIDETVIGTVNRLDNLSIPHSSILMLTSSVTGTEFNTSITKFDKEGGGVFTSLSGLSAGTNETGSISGSILKFTNDAGAAVTNFHVVSAHKVTTGSNYYIANSGTVHTTMWQDLEDKLITAGMCTRVDKVYPHAETFNQAIFQLTAAVEPPPQITLANDGRPGSTWYSEQTFGSLQRVTGGWSSYGALPDNSLYITAESKRFQIKSSHTADSPPNYYICNTGSNIRFWNALKSRIVEKTSYTTVNYRASAAYSASTTYALFSLTSSTTGSSYNSVLQETGSTYSALINITGGRDEGRQSLDNVIGIPRTDLTSSKHTITTRFSAPGDPSTLSRGYLNITTGEYSTNNNLNYRNYSVRSSGSGEEGVCTTNGTIRVNSNIGKREGNRTLLTRHCGKFGIDSQWGVVTATTYPTTPAYYKQHRNSLTIPTVISTEKRKAIVAPETTSIRDSTLSCAPFSSFWDPNDGFSLSFWMRRDTTGSAGIKNVPVTITQTPGAGPGSEGVASYIDLSTTATDMEWVEFDTSDNTRHHRWDTGIPLGQWGFYTFTWDGTPASKSMKLYVNGAGPLEYTLHAVVYSGSAPAPIWKGIKLFDRADNATTKELGGALSDCAIWKRVLTQNEITELYQFNGEALRTSYNGSLFDYWRLGTESTLNSIAVGSGIPNRTYIPSDIGRNTLVAGDNLSCSVGPYDINIAGDKQQHNNATLTSLLPQSDFQYAWINNTLSGSNGWMNNQKVRGFPPKSGEIVLNGRGSWNKLVPALTFPSASQIYGDKHG